MRRRASNELLDDDLGSTSEIEASLTDLRHINDWFGGTRTTIQLVREVARQTGASRLTLLEVGAGRGDVPLAARGALERDGLKLRVTLLDRSPTHLSGSGTPSVVAEALQLPFHDNALDVVSCSLLAHHFSPGRLQQFAGEMLRVCRQAVIINDLIRSRLHLALVYAGLPLFRSRLTWHDAPASVKQAYTTDEMRCLLSDVPARRIDVSTHYLYRMGVLLWK